MASKSAFAFSGCLTRAGGSHPSEVRRLTRSMNCYLEQALSRDCLEDHFQDLAIHAALIKLNEDDLRVPGNAL